MLPFLDHVYGTGWATGASDEYGAGKNVGWAYVLAAESDPPTSSEEQEALVYRAFPGSPNPFAKRTRIRFTIPTGQHVRAGVYDVLGRRVATLLHEYCPAGQHSVYWDGTSSAGRRAASGVYWCQLQAGAWHERIRVVLLR